VKGSFKDFGSTARSLAKNPLGIIALFIVLVYGLGCLVVGLGAEKLKGNEWHPLVLFLAVFPFVVLWVFAHLVARYPKHLYAPGDYRDEKNFLSDSAPARLQDRPNGGAAAATSDPDEVKPETETVTSLGTEYDTLVRFGFSLLHQTEVKRERTTPGSGRYLVRVWIEPLLGRPLDEIESVTYHVWKDFKNPVFVTREMKSNFDLWVSIYGEFPLLARVRLKSGDEFTLQRYLDLPGRPPD